MLSGNKISIKNVISKIYSDLNLSNEDNLVKIIEWIGEAMGHIKAHNQLETESAVLCVENFKAELPCGLLYLEEVEFNGRQMSQASAGKLEHHSQTDIILYNQYSSVDIRKLANKCFEVGLRYVFTDGTYFKMENGWFKTSFKEGQVNIVYKKFPVDDEGFPLIPEEESYRSALFWYVAWKYFFMKKITASGQDFNKFNMLSAEAEQKWHWYCGQAGAEAMMPDLFTLENIKRNFITLIPKLDSFSKSFSDLNK